MNIVIRLPLNTNAEQHARLLALQQAFAQVCNAITPVVSQTRVWNRVALHHMLYKQLREQFPALGSQLVCNAIYAVSRVSRSVYQHPASPFNLSRLPAGTLPTMRFVDTSPVYFDRHTLSFREGKLSLFTLDGRMRFDLTLKPAEEAAFREGKLREVMLSREAGGRFVLRFTLGDPQAPDADEPEEAAPAEKTAAPSGSEIPEYVLVEEVE